MLFYCRNFLVKVLIFGALLKRVLWVAAVRYYEAAQVRVVDDGIKLAILISIFALKLWWCDPIILRNWIIRIWRNLLAVTGEV